MDPKEMFNLYNISLRRTDIEAPKDPKEKTEALKRFIICINKEFNKSQLDLEIVKVKDEESEKQSGVMILKSKKDSSENDVEERLTSKAMVTFSTEELEYLKIIVQHILLSDTKEITSTFAVNRISDMKNSRKMTVQQAEVILHKFKEHYWLKFDDSNPNIRMTPRFINEMGTFLEKMYKKLNPDDDKCSQVKCGICNELVFQSVRCMICNTNYHLYCVHKALDKSSNKKVKCKRCPDEYLPTTLYKPKVPEQSFNRKRSRYTQSDSESESDE